MFIGPLFHWSPKRHRASILRHGLMCCQPRRLGPYGDGQDPHMAYVCLATSPAAGWTLILDPEGEELGWDLWQVVLKEGDPIVFRGEHYPELREIRVLRSLPADRTWWVAERGDLYAHVGIDDPAAPSPIIGSRRKSSRPKAKQTTSKGT